ncbi:hypothetical protein EIP86_002231 [Pleurotus ostreatoroseus]|nr:hypothetical protein EIP86_002231 [Pleurotus ostreatoroseus]
MLILLPAVLDLQHTTVVVLPLRALLNDLVRRLKSLDVRHEVWIPNSYSNQPLQPDINLVLVSIENAQKPMFKTALSVHHQHHPITRIVFDEVHEAITAFTYQLQYIIEPPQASLKALNTRVGTLVEIYSAQFRPEDRGLIYVEKKTTSQELAKLIGIPRYEGGDTMNDEERIKAYNEWINGGEHWMVCTSAFSAGIDCRTVRVVIHAGGPYTITGLAQQFGRGGRDGLHALGIIVPLAFPLWQHPITNVAADHTGEKLMQNILFGPSTGHDACIRFQLSHFLDGIGVACADALTVAQCNRCSSILDIPPPLTHAPHTFDNVLINNSLQPKRVAEDDITPTDFTTLHVAAKKQKTDRLQTTNTLDNTLEALFKQWKGTCLCCLHLTPSRIVVDHTFFQCPHLTHTQRTDYRGLRKFIKITYPSSNHGRVPKVCFKCGVPQVNKLHDTFGQGACEYEDLVYPTMWLVFTTPSLKHDAEQHFQQEWADSKSFGAWLSASDNNNLPNFIGLWQWRMDHL